jgi:carbonic anhydrase
MKIVHKTIVSCVLILALQIASSVDAQSIDYTTRFTCDASTNGAIQSPIDITPITCANIAVFDISFSSASAQFTFDTTTYYDYRWQPSLPFGTIGAVADDYGIDNYTAQWLQFKTPSEHSIRGAFAPLEAQIYFQSKNSSRQDAMFSILVYESRPPGQAYTDQFRATYFDAAATLFNQDTTGASPTASATIDLSGFATRANQYPLFYRYPGTTTVPGCKNVTWYVYSSPVYANNGTIIEGFRNIIKNYANANTGVIKLNASSVDPYNSASSAQFPGNAAFQTINFNADLIERFCYKEFVIT